MKFKKSHCINGHEYTEENSVFTTQGNRICRTCRAAAQAKYRLLHPVQSVAKAPIELAPGANPWDCRADHEVDPARTGPHGEPWCVDCYNEWAKNKPAKVAS